MVFFFNVYFFILRGRDRERSREGQREREKQRRRQKGREEVQRENTKRIPSRLHNANVDLDAELELMNHEIMT